MTWKGWAVLGMAASCIILVLVVMRLREQNFRLREKEIMEEITRHRFLADEAQDRATKHYNEALQFQKQAAAMAGELDEARKRYKRRVPAKTLKECKAQLDDADAYAFKLEARLAFEKKTVAALRQSVIDLEDQIFALDTAANLEGDRADLHRKSAKRAKVKKALIGIGAGVGGVLVGYGVGAAVK